MLKREAAKLNGETISISNSSDPYPRAEATEGLTRRCLEILAESNCKIQIITKSNLVTRDDDLLVKVPATVALTITTEDDQLAKILEPFAPTPSQRIRAAQDLIKTGIPVSVRIDPIIPFVNDQPQKLIATLANIGVKHYNLLNLQGKSRQLDAPHTSSAPNNGKTETALFCAGRKNRWQRSSTQRPQIQNPQEHARFS